MSNETFISLFMISVLVVLFGIACAIVPNFYLPMNILNLIMNYWYIILLGIGVAGVFVGAVTMEVLHRFHPHLVKDFQASTKKTFTDMGAAFKEGFGDLPADVQDPATDS